MAVFPHSRTVTAYREALDAERPLVALRDAVAAELAANGDDREAVLRDLDELIDVVRREGRDEDVVLDAIDFLAGWCSPHEVI